jgi:protein-S-isoprenylcysteine O-methyltransferase Ste14
MTFLYGALGLWGLFLASWYVAALWTARSVARTSWTSRAGDFLVYAVAFGLLLGLRDGWFAIWRTPPAAGWLLVAAETAGLAFAWWARLHIGRLWSGMITLREGHRVVDTGPYGLVRHPIYTGFIAAAWALALAEGAATALAGAALLTVQMAWKARREEAFLRRELGAEAYDAYADRTPMLIPFAPR